MCWGGGSEGARERENTKGREGEEREGGREGDSREDGLDRKSGRHPGYCRKSKEKNKKERGGWRNLVD
jgi:hypothetical protein